MGGVTCGRLLERVIVSRVANYTHNRKVNTIMASLSSSRVALVTGANQGIGLEIVRQLSKKFDGVILLSGMQNTAMTSTSMVATVSMHGAILKPFDLKIIRIDHEFMA